MYGTPQQPAGAPAVSNGQPTARLAGTRLHPVLVLAFGYSARHPSTGRPLREWVKALPKRSWDPDSRSWLVYATGGRPADMLAEAGFALTVRSITDPDTGLTCDINDVTDPVVFAGPAGERLVYPRLTGASEARFMVPALNEDATWDSTRGCYVIPPPAATLAPGSTALPDDFDRSLVRQVAGATGVESTPLAKAAVQQARSALAEHVGEVPAWFGLDLFGYQSLGAVAMAAGHTLIADEPGLGKGQPPETPLLTPTGWKTYGTIAVGEEVVGSNGLPTEVTGVYRRGRLESWWVMFGDESRTLVDFDHLWTVRIGSPSGREETIETRRLSHYLDEGLAVYVPLPHPIQFADCHTHHGRPLGGKEARRLGEVIRDRDQWGYSVLLYDFGCDPTLADDWDLPRELLFGSFAARVEFLRGLGIDGPDVRRHIDGVLPWRHKDPLTQLIQSLGCRIDGNDRLIGPAVVLALLAEHNLDPAKAAVLAGYGTKAPTVERQWIRASAVMPSERREIICISVAAEDSLYVAENFALTHNTRSSLAAASIGGGGQGESQRLLVVCPPVVLTHWRKEIEEAGVAGLRDGSGEIVSFVAGRKERPLPDKGVAIVPDSLLAARPALRNAVKEWAPDALILDEAHRARTWNAKRSVALREVAAVIPPGRRFAATGTPMMASPEELTSILAITGHLNPVFGGRQKFLSYFCRRNKYNAWVARPDRLAELKEMLDTHVWVRRIKAEVLKDLPPKMRSFQSVDVDLASFRAAHREVTAKVDEWIDSYRRRHPRRALPDEKAIEAWSRENIALSSPLRKAAGLAKVPVVIEMLSEWVEAQSEQFSEGPETGGTADRGFARPLIVWVHHHEVHDALMASLPDRIREVSASITGHTGAEERGQITEAFQAGRILVLFASITAAGVGITLTRSADAWFAETSFTPSDVVQAEDRINRFGQTRPVQITTLVAEGTLDATIQSVLLRKIHVLEQLVGGDQQVADASVAGGNSGAEVLREIALERVEKAGGKAGGSRRSSTGPATGPATASQPVDPADLARADFAEHDVA